jgi:hypothetical protein
MNEHLIRAGFALGGAVIGSAITWVATARPWKKTIKIEAAPEAVIVEPKPETATASAKVREVKTA